MSKKVDIIGAGITGLCAGCYLQMNGYETEIFESHNVPGGVCASWERKGYIFDGCIHWLVGSNPSDDFYRLWSELIDIEQLNFVYHSEYMRVEDENGQFISVRTDIDELEKEMLSKAPEDEKIILSFTTAVRKMMKMKMPIDKAPEVSNILDFFKIMIKVMPFWGEIKKWTKISAGDFAAKCKNPLLKRTFEYMFMPEMAVFFLVMTIAWMSKKSAGYPIGGSLNFARLFEKKYLELGGKINYNSKVKKILTKNNSTAGIQLENGETRDSDIVISAADGHYTIYEMLDGKYIDENIQHYYNEYKVFPSLMQVSLGISRTFTDTPHFVVFPLDKPLIIDPEMKMDDIAFHVYNYDSTLAPQGKTVAVVLLPTYNYKYWVDLREQDKAKYDAEKERLANEVIEIMDAKFGNIKSNVEVIDVSTPATLIRYTNNWKGSFEGWILTPEVGLKQMKKTLPKLDNFYMAGQWVEPGGGLPPSILSGRNVTQMICKKDRRPFKTL